MPPRENDDVCLLETDPGNIRMEHSSKFRVRSSEPPAPVVPADGDAVKETETEPVPTPAGLLQYILCMFVNFIVVLLGINWFLGFFGLALQPLEDLENTGESVQKFKEKKRKLEMIEKFNGIDEDQQKLTKRPKPGDLLGQERGTSATEDEELGINKKPVGSDKAKAIAEFQNRLWNMKPDLNFSNKEQQLEAEVMVPLPAKESDYDLVVIEEFNILEVEGDRKDVLKKVINPSESFDNVLNMSEDTSDIPTGDEVVDIDDVDENKIDILVEEDDESPSEATSGDNFDAQSEQYEECRVEDQVETAATNIGLLLQSDQNLISNEDIVDFETEPTDALVENECNDETSPPSYHKIEENNTDEVQIYEEESFANDIDDGSVASECDYPLLVKPDYAVQVKPDYPLQEKPDYAIQEKPDYALQVKPDYQIQRKPDYPVIEKPIYQVQEKPDYPVKEKFDYPISEKPNYQAQEKPNSLVLDSMVEKQDDLQLATKNDGPIAEKLFLEEQLKEKSTRNMTEMRTAEEQIENEDAVHEDNEKYGTIEMESCENIVELGGEEKSVTEVGLVCEKSEEILTQLSTAEEQTVEENPAAHDNEISETPGVEVCEDTTSFENVEEEKVEVVKEEGRRGSVGAKGKGGGGNKSGSKQKKKKRKVF